MSSTKPMIVSMPTPSTVADMFQAQPWRSVGPRTLKPVALSCVAMNSASGRPAGASSASRSDGNAATNPTIVLTGIIASGERSSCELESYHVNRPPRTRSLKFEADRRGLRSSILSRRSSTVRMSPARYLNCITTTVQARALIKSRVLAPTEVRYICTNQGAILPRTVGSQFFERELRNLSIVLWIPQSPEEVPFLV